MGNRIDIMLTVGTHGDRGLLMLLMVTVGCAMAVPTITIAPGVHMPLVGLGCGGGWGHNSTAVYDGATQALEVGYRLFDTADGYGTEAALGKALSESSVPRNELFITSKVPGGQNSSATTQSIEQSLKDLQVDYIDLMLIHFPSTWAGAGGAASRQETWRALEASYKAGKLRAIGVSHFCPKQIADILAISTVPIAVNQVEYHVGMGHSAANETDGKPFDAQHNITYQSFMPLCGQCGDTVLITGDMTNSIGKKYGKTGAQVALRWLVQQGIPAIPRTSSRTHQQQNIDLFDFALTGTEMQMLTDFTSNTTYGPRAPDGDCVIE